MMFIPPRRNLPKHAALNRIRPPYSCFLGAAMNRTTYSNVNQPTKTASAISKKYSASLSFSWKRGNVEKMRQSVETTTNMHDTTATTWGVTVGTVVIVVTVVTVGTVVTVVTVVTVGTLGKVVIIVTWLFHLGSAGIMGILKQVPQAPLGRRKHAVTKVLLKILTLGDFIVAEVVQSKIIRLSRGITSQQYFIANMMIADLKKKKEIEK